MARLPVLMYHNVSGDNTKSKGLTISQEKLEEQFKYLAGNYTSLHLYELENVKNIAKSNILITFDDVTVNQLEYAVPLLEKYNLKAVFFIPFGYVDKTDEWNKGTEKIMSVEQLKSINGEVVEFGYHSFKHRHYSKLSAIEINEDFTLSKQYIEENDLKVYPAVAYPYGNYPKKGIAKNHFFQLLESNGMKMGFRIGNKINSFPFKNKFEILRIDVKGEDSLLKFRLKLRFGKLKLF